MPGNSSDRAPTGGAGAHSSVDWHHLRVLVVDDHRLYRLLLGAMLEKLGMRHDVYANGQQALHAMSVQRFDLVISDCRMPVMDGYELTREIRQREQHAGSAPIPIIALSAHLALEDVRLCRACGMDAWLVKPLGLMQLREVLLYWLALPAYRTGHPYVPVRWKQKQATRTRLIEAFGSWDVVEPMLFNLLQEAYIDLTELTQARARLDALVTTQRLHRLVGSLAFLGATDLEPRAIELIARVNRAGVVINAWELEQFQQDIERYLQRLADL
ncbi:response regulator [Pseudomonas nabeulensis]|uniref:Response regulator n=1 Tax=Pseudomonas nabeulensis TaxID=2293833 RepID=A0A4Z0AUR3_9PSED|nr:response regulator [Pseudomonas nabeulensis]TFY90181.1 response regulator [Pseudomonas nabeulensis]